MGDLLRRSSTTAPSSFQPMFRRYRVAVGCLAIGALLTGAIGATATPARGAGIAAQPAGTTGGALTFDQAIETALVRNPQVVASREALTAAQQAVTVARAGLLPSVSLSGSGTYGSISTTSGATTASPNGAVQGMGSVSITGTLPVFDGGITQAMVAEAEAAVASAEASLQQTQQDVALNAATAFLSVLKAQRTVTVQEAQLASARGTLDLTQAQYRAGLVPQADVIQAQATVAQQEVNLLSARSQVDTAKSTLKGYLAADVLGAIEVQEMPNLPSTVSLAVEAVLRDAERRRPELAKALASVRSNQAAVTLATINAGPQLSVNVTSTYVPLATSSTSATGASIGVTGTLSLPLFDSGKGQASINEAKATLRSAQAQAEASRVSVRQDAYQSYLSAVQAAANVGATDAADRAAAEALRAAEGRYRAGVATLVDVTTARSNAVQAAVNAVNARYDYATALATLQHAMGAPIRAASLGGGQ